MPLPRAADTCEGAAFPIDNSFSIALAGAGSRDGRVQGAAYRLTERLSRQTGIPLLPHVNSEGSAAKLTIVVESPSHIGPQRLGDPERYSLDVKGNGARLSADGPLGVLRGMETFLQLAQFAALCLGIDHQPQQAEGGQDKHGVSAEEAPEGPRMPHRLSEPPDASVRLLELLSRSTRNLHDRCAR